MRFWLGASPTPVVVATQWRLATVASLGVFLSVVARRRQSLTRGVAGDGARLRPAVARLGVTLTATKFTIPVSPRRVTPVFTGVGMTRGAFGVTPSLGVTGVAWRVSTVAARVAVAVCTRRMVRALAGLIV